MSIVRARRSGTTPSNSPKKTRSLQDASGLPGPVVGLSASATSSSTASLSWSAPVNVGDSAITSYIVSGGGTPSVSGTTATVVGLVGSTSYTFLVRAANAVGSGVTNSAGATTLAYNAATGGTVTEFISAGEPGTTTGARYRVHRFNSTATLTTTVQGNNFDFFLLGGGTSGGGGGSGNGGAGGQGGKVVSVNRSAAQAGISLGNNTVTIGNAGDGNTTIGTLTSSTGGRANGGASPGGNSSNPGQAGTSTQIAGGTAQVFGGGGGSGAFAQSCGDPYGCWYGGGAGGSGGGASGGNALHWQGGGQALGGNSAGANTGGGGGGGGGSSQGFGAGGGSGGSGTAFIRYEIAT